MSAPQVVPASFFRRPSVLTYLAATASRCVFHVRHVSSVTLWKVGLSTCGTGTSSSFSIRRLWQSLLEFFSGFKEAVFSYHYFLVCRSFSLVNSALALLYSGQRLCSVLEDELQSNLNHHQHYHLIIVVVIVVIIICIETGRNKPTKCYKG